MTLRPLPRHHLKLSAGSEANRDAELAQVVRLHCAPPEN